MRFDGDAAVDRKPPFIRKLDEVVAEKKNGEAKLFKHAYYCCCSLYSSNISQVNLI